MLTNFTGTICHRRGRKIPEMHVLYLTNGFPYPLTSGYLRHYFLIKELAERHAITLLSVAGPGLTDEHVAALRPFTRRVLAFASGSKGRSLPRKVINRMQSLVQMDETVGQMRQATEKLMQEEPFDVVISGKRTLPAIIPLGNLPLIADMCDATSARIRRSIRYANPARLPWLLLEYARMRRTEQVLMARAAHSLFISCRDREDLLAEAAATQTTIVPNGVDLSFWRRSSRERGHNTIVFTGVMSYWPNTDAALYLIEEVFPLVRRSIPGAQLFIVGRDPTPQLVKAGRQPGVIVTGPVDDVRPYLEQATVFAAPLRFGAGVQNKVLEAMAMEVPVVASPLAADGLRTEDGQQPPLQIAADRQQFAEQIIQKLAGHTGDPVPDRAVRRFVETNFVWSRSGARLGQVIDRVANGVEQ